MPISHLIYIPPEYVEGKRTYIKFYYKDPFTHKLVRKRLTFDLNRIADLEKRRVLAQKYVKDVEEQLAQGIIPFVNEDLSPSVVLEGIIAAKKFRDDISLKLIDRNRFISIINLLRAVLEKEDWTQLIFYKEENKVIFTSLIEKLTNVNAPVYVAAVDIFGVFRTLISNISDFLPSHILFSQTQNLLQETKILDAIAISQKIKNTTDRQRTRDMVNSMVNIFTTFIDKKEWRELPVGEFDKKKAMAFLDYAQLDRGVGSRTYNNYIERMRAMFTELKDRDYVETNPFSGLKKKKIKGKQRRAFSDTERDIVAAAIEKSDKWLMLGVLLQYHCFIRPIELRRLRFKMFDFNESVIRLKGDITKNGENEIVTIPDVLMAWLLKFDFSQWNQNWLIFGVGVQPHPHKCCGHNTLNYRHGQMLKKLQQKGMLVDLKGLTFYSWKDTGAMDLFKAKVNVLEIMRQLRHKDLATTQEYCQSLYIVNHEIKTLNNSITTQKLIKKKKPKKP